VAGFSLQLDHLSGLRLLVQFFVASGFGFGIHHRLISSPQNVYIYKNRKIDPPAQCNINIEIAVEDDYSGIINKK
jgi:hypothetical protein